MMWLGRRELCGALAVALFLVLGLAHRVLAWDQPQWVRQLGTGSMANAAATDRDGNVYIGGNSAYGSAYFVAKYSTAGALRWVRQLVTGGGARGVATDGNDNVYIAGGTGVGDALVAKYSGTGLLRWKRQFGTAEAADYAAGVATDCDGNVYIAGYTEGSLGGAQRGGGDAWVAKYSAAGALHWKRQLGTSEWDVANGVATDDDGNVYIAGETFGSLGGSNQGDRDGWIAKYSPAGAVLWKRQFAGVTEEQDTLSGVATDGDGNVYIAGDTWAAYVAKYSAAGTLLWTQLGPFLDCIAATSGVATDGDGNVYVGGALTGFDECSDAYLAKFSRTGALRWTRTLDISGEDAAQSVATDGDGNVYIAGYTGGLGGHAFVAKYFTRR
jgi:Beta-propeller repeat